MNTIRKIWAYLISLQKCKDSVFPDQGQCIIMDADEMEKSRSISFYEESENWDDDNDDDDD